MWLGEQDRPVTTFEMYAWGLTEMVFRPLMQVQSINSNVAFPGTLIISGSRSATNA